MGGGVKLAKSSAEVRDLAEKILGMQLVTHQTGPQGQKVRRLLIEAGADIAKELYVGMVVDRGTQRVVLMASSEGGMDIEGVAAMTPEKIHKVFIDPKQALSDAEAHAVARKIGIPEEGLKEARQVLQGLYRAFDETDASLAEINPLIVTGDGRVIALDAKLTVDDNGLLRNPGLRAILVNIFGGIMKCDTIATGVVAAAREVKLKVPLIVRMKGTNEELGKKILAESGLPVITADNMAEAGEKAVAAARGT